MYLLQRYVLRLFGFGHEPETYTVCVVATLQIRRQTMMDIVYPKKTRWNSRHSLLNGFN